MVVRRLEITIFVLAIAFAVTFVGSFAKATDVPQSFTLDGQLFGDALSTQPLLDGAVDFKIQILDQAKVCVVYEEEQSVSTLASKGYFTIQVGTATTSPLRTADDSANTMASVYQNINSVSGKLLTNGAPCTAGGTAGQRRYVRVTIMPSTMGGAPRVLSPDLTIDSVPNALVAERAESLQGLRSADVLKVNTAAGSALSQTNLESLFTSVTRFNSLSAVVDGTSSSYMRSNSPSGAQLPVLPGAPTTPPIGAIWFDSTDSLLKYQTASGPSSLGSGSGTVTSVGFTAPAELSVAGAPVTTTGTIAVTWAQQTTGKVFASPNGSTGVPTFRALVAADAPFAIVNGGGTPSLQSGTDAAKGAASIAGRVWIATDTRLIYRDTGTVWEQIGGSGAPTGTAGGDLDGTYPNPSVDAIRGVAISAVAPNDGQVLKYFSTGTTWAASNFGIGDLKTAGGAAQFASAACTAAQTLTWASLTNTFTCSNIAGLDAAAITTGTIDAARLPASSGYWAAATGGINYAGGRVGIGTATPGEMLSVVGSNGSGSVAMFTGTGGSSDGYITLYAPNSSGRTGILFEGRGGGGVNSWILQTAPTGDDLYLQAGNNVNASPIRVTFAGNGNVGIGPTTPATALDLGGAMTFRATSEPAATAAQGKIYYDTALNKFRVSQNGGAYMDLVGGAVTSLSAADGTVGAPSISFASSPTTGFFRPAADVVAISTSGSERIRITNSGRIGVGTATPLESIDTAGALRLGTTTGTNAGTIRFDGANFQGYNGSSWTNFIAQTPAATTCDTTQVLTTAGTYAYTVPASYGTITIRLWGSGGGGGGAGTATGTVGGQGQASTIISLGLIASGGSGGEGVLGGNLGTGGTGGTASGGDVNTSGTTGGTGEAGQSGFGGGSPNGGGNRAGASSSVPGAAGFSPGGGGAGGSSNINGRAGGGGGGGYIEKVYTSATLAPGTYLPDIVVGIGGTSGAGSYVGGGGAVGRISIACATAGTLPANDRGLVFWNAGSYDSVPTFIYNSSGNLGLGTATPGYKLDVVGDVNITGNFKVNGTNFTGGGSGTVTNVTGTLPISVATGTTTPVVSIATASTTTSGALSNTDWNTFNSKLTSPLTSKGDLLSHDGSAHVRLPAGSNGQVLVPDSGEASGLRWANFSIENLKTAGGATQFASASCTTAQTLTWSSLTNTFTCSNIAGLDAAVITTGTIDAARLPASVTPWVAATGGINYASGNVGIGTGTPTSLLSLVNNADKIGTSIAMGSNVGDFMYLSANRGLNYNIMMENANSGGTVGHYFRVSNADMIQRFSHVSADNGRLDFIGEGSLGIMSMLTGNGNVGINTTTPLEKFSVNGGVQVGNSTGSNAGTIRWNGTSFQGYIGSSWVNLSGSAAPGTSNCDTTETYSTAGNYSYNVPASFGTITIRVWGAGGSGGGSNQAGGASNGVNGGASSVNSLGLLAGGGGAGGFAASSGGVTSGAGGPGGVASGGTINTNGAAGSNGAAPSGGNGGNSPGGGAGGIGGYQQNVQGTSPGGGGAGGAIGIYAAGGGGAGAYVEKTYTSLTLAPGTNVNDIVVGAGPPAFFPYGGGGGAGSVTISCATAGTPPANDRSVLFVDSGNYSNSTNFVYSAAGNLGISNPAPSRLLHVGSASTGTGLAVANFQNADGTCTITPAAAGSGIACSSDERLKENFQNVTGDFALDKLLQLQAVTYNFKTASDETRRTGYRAQDVQKIAPEFVRENDDGLLQVYYDAFIPWITESMKSLHSNQRSVASEVERLKIENASQNEKIRELEKRLEKLEKSLKSN